MELIAASVKNLEAIDIPKIPLVNVEEFRETVVEKIRLGERISALFAMPLSEGSKKKIMAVADYQFGSGAGEALFAGNIEVVRSKKTGKSYLTFSLRGNKTDKNRFAHR